MLHSMCTCAQSLQLCPSLCDPLTVAHQNPQFMGFSRQEYWSGLLCPPPGDIPNPGIEPHLLQSLLKLMSIKSVIPSSHLILCYPLLLLPPIPPSIRVFSSESTLHMWWPKYWSFSFSISPSNEHPGLISFRMDWLDLLAVQGTLKSLLWDLNNNIEFFVQNNKEIKWHVINKRMLIWVSCNQVIKVFLSFVASY